MKKAIALFIAAGLPAALMIAYRMHQTSGFAAVELIVYPLVFAHVLYDGLQVGLLLMH